MSGTTVERQKLIEEVSALPDDVLLELASFLEYLRYKSSQHQETSNTESNFLLSIAGLGHSGQQDIAERNEEILRSEVDPIHGWGSRSDESS
jgi:hypothetical protein